jgi:high affinity sulfate transporter 1
MVATHTPLDEHPDSPVSHRRLALFQGLLPIDRTKIPTDLIAGVTLAALAIPEVMGYSAIAGMPVITGLYTMLLPIFAFAILGSSRHLVVGADSATAAVMAAGLAGLATAQSDQYVALAGLLALMTAGFLIVARLVNLGFIANFLSRTVLIGFLTGVGIQVACGQVAGMLGVSQGTGVTVFDREFTNTIGKLISTLGNLDEVSWTTVAVTVGVLGTIQGLKFVTTKVPGALVAVIGAIVISWNWDLASHGVATLGPLPSGLPSIGLPDVAWSDIPPLLGTAVSIFILVLAQSAATSRAYAAKYNERFDENVDLVGLSAASAMAGVSGTFVVNGSPTKTQMVDGAGGISQFAQIGTGVIVAVVLLFLTAPIQYMPTAVLAAVVFSIGLELVDLEGMRKVLRLRPDEFVVATLVAATVVIVGVEQGIVLAIVASIIDHMRRSYRPSTAVLQSDGNDRWRNLPPAPDVRTAPGIVVYRFSGSLYYANANLFFEQTSAFAHGDAPPEWLCIAAEGIADIDYSGSETIRQLHGDLQEHGSKLVIAGAIEPVRELLDRYGLTDLLGSDAIFDTTSDALVAFDSRPTDGTPPARTDAPS